jgi:hypothetical protein
MNVPDHNGVQNIGVHTVIVRHILPRCFHTWWMRVLAMLVDQYQVYFPLFKGFFLVLYCPRLPLPRDHGRKYHRRKTVVPSELPCYVAGKCSFGLSIYYNKIARSRSIETNHVANHFFFFFFKYICIPHHVPKTNSGRKL